MTITTLPQATRPLVTLALPSGAEVVAAVDEALSGGPAVALLDPALPTTVRYELLGVLRPARVVTEEAIADLPAPRAVPTEVAVAVATSGSTGSPRVLLHTGEGLRAAARASLERLGAGAAPWVCCLPMSHLGGLGVAVRALLADAELTVLPPSDLVGLASVLQQRPAWTALVPTQLRRLLESGATLAGQGLLLGGAALDPALRARAEEAGARVVATYGLTETAGGCVYDGRPLEGVEVARTPDGRIRLRAPWPAAFVRTTTEDTPVADRDGWLTTSDLGRFAEDGRLEVLGRADDVIVTGGVKVAPDDVERALRDLPAVADALVVGLPDPEWGQVVTAVVVPAGERVVLDELREELRDRVAPAARPRRLVVVEAVPVLPSGKPDRRQARVLAREDQG